MSLTQALSAAISGLKVNQSGLALVAANVANADTPGYVRKTVNQVATAGNNTGISVSISAIQRELDTYVQRQLRVENSGASYADTRAQILSAAAGHLRPARLRQHAGDGVQQFHQCSAGAVDQPGRSRGAQFGDQRRAIADPAAQPDERQHPGPARRRRARHRRRGDQGQRGDEPDRHAQSEDRRIQPERQRDRHA